MSGTMYTGEDITINGVVFNRVDEEGNRWIITDLDGWWGLPDATVPDDTRPFQDDGSYFAAGRYEARQITVSGYIVPGALPGSEGPYVARSEHVLVDESGPNSPSNWVYTLIDPDLPDTESNRRYAYTLSLDPAQRSARAQGLSAARARNSLNRAMNLVRSTAIMQVDETLNGGSKIAAVQLVAKPLTKFNDYRNTLEFNFQLRAADPRKYSATPSIDDTLLASVSEGRTYDREFDYVYGAPGNDGFMTVTNAGSYNTYGVITIYGPVSHPSIEHIEQGKTVSIDISIGEDEFLVVNLKDRTILLNGEQSRRNKLDPGSEWFNFQPGESTLRFSGSQIPMPRPEYPAIDNLATNPSFETEFGTGGVKLLGSVAAAMPASDSTYQTVTRSSTWSFTGSHSLMHTVTGKPSADSFVYPAGTSSNLTRLGLVAGGTYTISSYFYQAAAQTGTLSAQARTIALVVTAASLPGGTSTYYSEQAPNTEGVTRLSLTVSLPLDTTSVSLRLMNGSMNSTVYWDGLMIQTGSMLSSEYFDGNSPYGVWAAAPNDSTSSRPLIPEIPGARAEVMMRSAWIE